MLYWILKPVIQVFLRLYYKVEYIGKEHIPENVPVVFAPNHVNAVMDALFIGMVSNKKVRFFARGDAFKNKIAAFLLMDMGVRPIYRIQEGYAELKNNNNTFKETQKLLSSNKHMLVFPEGNCVTEKRLRPLKKGLARIVFDAAEMLDFKGDVVVLPVGLNYENTRKMGSNVCVHIGKPIHASNYYEVYKENKVKVVNEFTKMLENEMKKHLVINNHIDNDALLNTAQEILCNELKPTENTCRSRYYLTTKLAEALNKVTPLHHVSLNHLKSAAELYQSQLNKYHINDECVKNLSEKSKSQFFFKLLIVIMLLPLYVVGVMLNGLPYLIARYVADKKIKKTEFYASVYGNLAMLLWLMFFIVQLIFIGVLFQDWTIVLIYAILVSLAGIFSIKFKPYLTNFLFSAKLLLMKDGPIKKLTTLRASFIKEFQQFR